MNRISSKLIALLLLLSLVVSLLASCGEDGPDTGDDAGHTDYVSELLNDESLSPIQTWNFETKVKDREDKPLYKLKADIALAFSNKLSLAEYYHNSIFLEHVGAPERAVQSAGRVYSSFCFSS